MVAVKAVTKDIDLADGSLDTERDSPVDNAKCNTCHDNIIIHNRRYPRPHHGRQRERLRLLPQHLQCGWSL